VDAAHDKIEDMEQEIEDIFENLHKLIDSVKNCCHKRNESNK